MCTCTCIWCVCVCMMHVSCVYISVCVQDQCKNAWRALTSIGEKGSELVGVSSGPAQEGAYSAANLLCWRANSPAADKHLTPRQPQLSICLAGVHSFAARYSNLHLHGRVSATRISRTEAFIRCCLLSRSLAVLVPSSDLAAANVVYQ